jgi:HEPN domain-containing protein
VEKYLKARLTEAGLAFGKTHDLPSLLNLVATIEPSWSRFTTAFVVLTQWAVLPRYPGPMPTGTTRARPCRRVVVSAHMAEKHSD